MTNIHHLELFYYVARFGGVSAAARRIPYGIQQPAISAQILQLENSLGVTLFGRRPFKLTREGLSLFEFIAPFFGGIEEISKSLRGGSERRLRIAAAEIIQREYLPMQLDRMRKRVPGFSFTLTHGRQAEFERMLQNQEIDFGLGLLTERMPSGLQSCELIELSPVLLVHRKSRFSNAEQILGMDRIDVPLVTLGSAEALSRRFQEGLSNRGLEWVPSLELGGLDLVARYVSEGFGVGVGLHLPGVKLPRNIKELPLPGFPKVSFGIMWGGQLSPVGKTFLEEAGLLARELFSEHPGS